MRNKIQQEYILAKAILKKLEEKEREVDCRYIEENNIFNQNGTIPRAAWAIDDDNLAEIAIEECARIVKESGLWDKILCARQILQEAEQNLVEYGISLIPNSKDREIMKEAVSKNYTIRQKVIDLTLRLNSKTVSV